MAYSERARALRRCVATTKHGEPCRSFALWDRTGLWLACRPWVERCAFRRHGEDRDWESLTKAGDV
jgi:hypothetical protein